MVHCCLFAGRATACPLVRRQRLGEIPWFRQRLPRSLGCGRGGWFNSFFYEWVVMKIGVPAEIKSDEYRVAMLPSGAHALVAAGHRVMVQSGAGLGSGIDDDAYRRAGAVIGAEPAEVFQFADLIVKVKEPLPDEWPLIKAGQLLFTYFHLAADRQLTEAMLQIGASCFAYETLTDAAGRLPLLTPMSEVAGRMSIQEGAKYLEKTYGGRGVLLPGVPGVAPARVTVLGAGVVGTNAARLAAGMGANVTLLDINLDRLRYLDEILPTNVDVLFSDRLTVQEQLTTADLVIGAVLVPGGKAPQLVRADDLKLMQPGAVLVDVAIDQGGCFETSRPTTHRQPTFVVDGIVHYCVGNMPGAVARTSTYALNNATLPWVQRLADQGAQAALQTVGPLQSAANIHAGKIVHPAVAAVWG